MAGAVAGGVIGQLIPFSLDGIDFCMTALFVIIFIDQWEKADSHIPAITGIAAAILCLYAFGTTAFMLPSLILVSGILVCLNMRRPAREAADNTGNTGRETQR